MKFNRLLIFVMAIAFSCSAFAFGGGGGGGGRSPNRTNERYKGVNTIGIHIDPDHPIDPPDFVTCDDPNATADEYGICLCNPGYQEENDVCVVNACYDFSPSGCYTACSSSGGQATYTICQSTGTCTGANTCDYPVIIPCDVECGSCQVCNTATGQCEADQNQEGLTCTNDPGSICNSGNCKCDSTLHLVGEPESCTCATNYYGTSPTCNSCPTHASCPGGTTFTCNDGYESNGTSCVCSQQKYVNSQGVCTACPEHASCDGTSFTCDQNYLKEGDACVIDACVQLAIDYPDCLDTCSSTGGVATATYKETCGDGNNWTCNATTHACENPCTGQTATGCVKTLAPVGGVCSETEYQDEGYVCDTNKQCNASHECVCAGYMKDSVCTACPEHASCDGTTYTCNASGHWVDDGNGACECDSANGWNPDSLGNTCIQCSATGTTYDSTSHSCICDGTNHWIDDGNGGCTCDTNYKLEQDGTVCALDACVALSTQYPKCLDECTSEGGVVTSATYHTTCSSTADPDDNDDWLCNATTHACENPCNAGQHDVDDCILAWTSSHGTCVPEYADNTTSCEVDGHSGFMCDGEGHCGCPEGYYIKESDYSCALCPTADTTEMTEGECNQCFNTWYNGGKCYKACPDASTHWRTSDDGRCYECVNTTKNATSISVESCQTCEGLRYIDPDANGGPKCWTCNHENNVASTERTFDNFQGEYATPQRLQQFIDLCNACPNRQYNTTSKRCECKPENKHGSKCCQTGTKWSSTDGKCVSSCDEGEFYSLSAKGCIPCTDSNEQGHSAIESECERCNPDPSNPQRIFVSNKCLPVAPHGKIIDNRGVVYDCDSTVVGFGVANADQCNNCDNRIYTVKTDPETGKQKYQCTRCDYQSDFIPANGTSCDPCTNRIFEDGVCKCNAQPPLPKEERMVPIWNSQTYSYDPAEPTMVVYCPES